MSLRQRMSSYDHTAPAEQAYGVGDARQAAMRRMDWPLLVKACCWACLSISLAFPLSGCLLQARAGGTLQPPTSMLHFDKIFRRFGTLLPLISLTLRFFAERAFSKVKAPVNVQTSLVMWGILQSLRLLLYIGHVSSIYYGVWVWLLDSHGGHIMSDHGLLGLSVQANLCIEVAMASYSAVRLLGVRQQTSETSWALYLHIASLCTGWVLIVLVSADMFVTANYYHPPGQTLVALVIGLILFWLLPAHALQQRLQVQVDV